jgi:hypothetical protein
MALSSSLLRFMGKAIVFISHICEEREIAVAFRELVASSFPGMIDVFVSSDEHSVAMGQKWLNNITEALQICSVEVILCSPHSVDRPWINFEAGAGWIRDIPVIPLCHSGIEPSTLPLPLNLLQAAKAGEVASLQLIFPVLAQAIGAQVPKVDFSEFVAKVKQFESAYTFWNECNASFTKINEIDAKIIPYLRTNQGVTLNLTETKIGWLEQFTQFLEKQDILKLQRTGFTNMTNNGVFHGCVLIPLSKLQTILADKHFHVP